MPSLVAMAVANVLNIGLNFAFVDAWGAPGVAAATTIARIALFFALFAWVLADPRVRAALRRLPSGSVWGPGGWAAGAEFRAIGLAGGAANFFETAAFAALAQFAGHAGPAALAVFTIGANVQSTLFMAALGLSVATGVRVGSEMGAGRPTEAAFAGWTGLCATMALMLAIGLAVFAVAPVVAGFYTTDPAIIARVAPLLLLVALVLVFDGGQVVLGQCVRAIGDTWFSAVLLFAAFLLLMAPLGWALGGMWAERGLMLAAAIGCMSAVVLLSLRFHILTRKDARA
jgi:MATE family multidrug resistance protein